MPPITNAETRDQAPGLPHAWGDPHDTATDLWETLVDASFDAFANTPTERACAPNPTKQQVSDLLVGHVDPAVAARRYEDPVFRLTGRLGLEGEIYRDALRQGLIPRGAEGVLVIRAAHHGGTPMPARELMAFLTNWWAQRLVSETA